MSNTAAVENEFSSEESQQTNDVNSCISKNLPFGTLETFFEHVLCSFDLEF